MAKVVGLVGSASGKLGNVVYAVTNGMQVARVYQPVVSNPKSNLQMLQRAKGNLIGQLSGIVPHQVLVGLGINKRARRAAFLKHSLRAATATVSDNVITAKIQPVDIILSQGAVAPNASVSALLSESNAVDLTLTWGAGQATEDALQYGMMVVAILADAQGKYERVVYAVVPASEYITTPKRVNMFHPAMGAYSAFFYAIPFKTTDGSNVSTVAGRMGLDTTDLAATLTVNPNALPLEWGESQYVGSAVYEP